MPVSESSIKKTGSAKDVGAGAASGAAIGAVAAPATLGLSVPVGAALGGAIGYLGGGGGQGSYWSPNGMPAQRAADSYSKSQETANSQSMSDLIRGYGTGQMSMSDAIKGTNFRDQQTARNILATDPTTGSRFATEQVQQNPMLSSVFGQGGALERSTGRVGRLEDEFGQVSEDSATQMGQLQGNITRQYGQMDNDLSAQLASRGLSAGSSGAAAAAVGGQMGNKYEQLASQSMNLQKQNQAQQLQALTEAHQNMQNLTGQGSKAIDEQFARQLGGRQQTETERQGMLKSDDLALSSWQAQNDAELASLQDKRASYKKGMFENVMDSASGAVGQAPGTIIGGLASKGTSFGGGAGGGAGTSSASSALRNTPSR